MIPKIAHEIPSLQFDKDLGSLSQTERSITNTSHTGHIGLFSSEKTLAVKANGLNSGITIINGA